MLQKKTKSKISSVKQKNVKHNKLKKQGKLKSRRNRPQVSKDKTKKPIPKPVVLEPEEEESDNGEELLEMIDKDDLNFLRNAVANNSYSILDHVRYKEYVFIIITNIIIIVIFVISLLILLKFMISRVSK